METLARQLDAFADGLIDRTDPRTAETLRRVRHGLCAAARGASARGVGDAAVDFRLTDQAGAAVDLASLRRRGPVVLIFVRGGWCPFCTLTLRSYNKIAASVRRLGGEIVAVSPQSVAQNAATAEANALQFPVVADPGCTVARAYGLVWTLDAELRDLYARLGHDIPRLVGSGDWELPITASYVIDRAGRIAIAHVDPRATVRLEPAEALAQARQLAADAEATATA